MGTDIVGLQQLIRTLPQAGGDEGGCAGLGRCCCMSARRDIAGAAGEEQPEQGCRGSKRKQEGRELW